MRVKRRDIALVHGRREPIDTMECELRDQVLPTMITTVRDFGVPESCFSEMTSQTSNYSHPMFFVASSVFSDVPRRSKHVKTRECEFNSLTRTFEREEETTAAAKTVEPSSDHRHLFCFALLCSCFIVCNLLLLEIFRLILSLK